jgi:hypothetical protein
MQLVQTNRRRSPRFSVSRKIAATLNVNGRLFEGTVADYGVTGLALEVPKAAAARVEREKTDVEVTLKNTTLSGVVRHTRINEAGAILGVALKVTGEDGEVSFTSDDPGWDLIENKETIDQIFHDVALKGPEVQISAKQIQSLAILLPEKLIDGTKLVAEIFEAKRGKLAEGRASFQFEMFQTCHAFESKLRPVENNRMEIEIPATLARLLRRETYRVRNGANERFLKIRMVSDVLGTPDDAIQVYDFSEHGISIIDPSGWACAPIGTKIEAITITTSDGRTIAGQGEIRGFRWIPSENAYSIGIQFDTASDTDRTEWHNAILYARYPGLAFTYQEKDYKPIWELFDRSKYLGLKPRESFNYVFDIGEKTWKQMSDAGTKISKRVMIKKDETIVGHLQIDRIYPETWCAHALAIDPSVSKTVGKDIYSVTTDVLSAEKARFLISITESHLKWNQRNYYDFVKTYRFPEHNDLRLFQVHEAEMNVGWDLPSFPGLETRIANRYDLKRIARYFELHAIPLEREALGLTPEHLDLKSLSRELEPFGLSRKREFVVGLLGNKFAGFASLETGTTGISIFGIQDTMYVYLAPDLGSDRIGIHDGLLAAGLERYREFGVPTVNVYIADNRRDYLSERGLKFIWEGVRWISLCEAARRYHAYTQMLYGHLLFRREEIRKRQKNS